jgi:hypothetical protein
MKTRTFEALLGLLQALRVWAEKTTDKRRQMDLCMAATELEEALLEEQQ